MRAVIQKVKQASVNVEGSPYSSIDKGLLVLLGIEDADRQEDIEWLAKKIINLRIFEDQNQIMNHSILDIEGEILVVSQFTLMASTKKGNRPTYLRASKQEFSEPMYEKFLAFMQTLIKSPVKHGKFGSMMDITLVNWGPTTIIIDTKNKE
jgi:D-tyrosyl-tRNA(Tyr) deacylase